MDGDGGHLTTRMTDLAVVEIGELVDERTFRVRALELYAQGQITNVIGIEGVRELTAGPRSTTYDVTWNEPIAYMVRDESYTLGEAAPANLHRLSASTFLDLVAGSTWATPEHPGPIEHWRLVTADHVVDVAALSAPRVIARRVEA